MVIVLLLCIIYLIVCISIGILLRKIIFPEEFVYNVCRIFWTRISVGTCIFRRLKLEDIKSVCTLWPVGTESEMWYGGLRSELFVLKKLSILWLHVKFALPTPLAWLPCLCNVTSPSVSRRRGRHRTLISCRSRVKHATAPRARPDSTAAAFCSSHKLRCSRSPQFVHYKTQKRFGRNGLYIFIALN